jgi:hypothetical protein
MNMIFLFSTHFNNEIIHGDLHRQYSYTPLFVVNTLFQYLKYLYNFHMKHYHIIIIIIMNNRLKSKYTKMAYKCYNKLIRF